MKRVNVLGRERRAQEGGGVPWTSGQNWRKRTLTEASKLQQVEKGSQRKGQSRARGRMDMQLHRGAIEEP